VNVAGVVRARARLVLRAWLAGRGARRGPVGAVITLALGAVAYSAIALVFVRLAGEELDATGGARLLALVLTVTLVGLLVLDLQDAVATLVVDPDLEVIRRAPVPDEALLAMKLADALPRTTLLVAVLALPATLAYATAWPLPAWAWAALPVQLAAFWAMPLGLGTAAALALLAALPARRVRDGLALLSALTVTAVWLLNTLVLPRLGAGDESAAVPGLEAWLRPSTPLDALSPARTLAEALAAAAAEDPAAAARATLGLLAGAAAALAVAAVTARALLDRVQSRLAAGEAGPRVARPAPSRATMPRGVVRAVVARDLRLFLRDWTVLGDVATTAALWALVPFVSAPVFGQPAPLVVRAMLIALTVGLGHEIAARMLPFERRGSAWMRLAPVAPGRWLAGKFAGALALTLPLLAVASTGLALAHPVGPAEWVWLACLAVPALVLALATGLWVGAAFGDPEWTNPLAMLEFGGRLLGLGLLLAQVSWWIAVAVVTGLTGPMPLGFHVWGPGVAGLLMALLPLAATRRRLASDPSH
jgi:hypothetical protein